eukprot:TRINITY_DN3941_c0_g1_i3.p2 TRINITY_DN3941_c0_g1~~TRINITY_DN3941_c0_g1_i3.p2  ORF type:complete len:238 (+),score=30.72 TRINITY_DN3941_c0_g1_i3:427-1140(+)
MCSKLLQPGTILDQSDANEENLSSTGSSDERLSQFSSLSTTKGNNFPAIIGSQTFMNDQFLGIKIEEIVPQIQFEPVAVQQTIMPGNIQMVQSNLPMNIPQAPSINVQQSNIPQPPPPINTANIPQAPQLNVQSNIPQAPQMQSSIPQAPQMQSNIPKPPQMSMISSIPQPPKLPTLPQQQSNIVQSASAPPPPPLNLIPKPPVLPSLPKPKPVQKPPQQQQEKPKPAVPKLSLIHI